MHALLCRVLIGVVRLYQVTVGFWLSGHCRFVPTCSEYMIEAIRKHGAATGLWRGLRRIVRCRPGGGYGYDPP